MQSDCGASPGYTVEQFYRRSVLRSSEHFARAARLLTLAGLAVAGMGTNPHGTPLVFLVKRVLGRKPS